MNTKGDKLGFVLAITAFTFGSLTLLLNASCSRARQTPTAAPPPIEVAETPTHDNETTEADTGAEATQCTIFHVWEVNRQPEVIKDVMPRYPEKAIIKEIEAVVVLLLTVDENGDVIDVEVLHSKAKRFRKEFIEAAITAAKQHKYKPAIHAGKPVACRAKVTIRFRLK